MFRQDMTKKSRSKSWLHKIVKYSTIICYSILLCFSYQNQVFHGMVKLSAECFKTISQSYLSQMFDSTVYHVLVKRYAKISNGNYNFTFLTLKMSALFRHFSFIYMLCMRFTKKYWLCENFQISIIIDWYRKKFCGGPTMPLGKYCISKLQRHIFYLKNRNLNHTIS